MPPRKLALVSVFQSSVDLVTGLAWPAVVGVIAFMFRSEIRDLLRTPLSRLKAGPFEVEIERARVEVEAATAGAAQSPAPPAGGGSKDGDSPRTGELTDDLQRLGEHVMVNPSAVILDGYVVVENTLRDVLSDRGINGTAQMNGVGLASRAVQTHVILPATLESVQGLAVLRNLTAHGTAGDVTPDKARDYLNLVEAVVWTIQQNAKQSQRSTPG